MLVLLLHVTYASAQNRGVPKMTIDQMHGILTNQPDFRARMHVANEERFPGGVSAGRIARRGRTYRLEPGDVFSDRSHVDQEVPGTKTVWLVRLAEDRAALIDATVLVLDRRAFAAVDVSGGGDSLDSGFNLLLLLVAMPYPMLIEGARLQEAFVLSDDGEALVGKHRCAKIRAATRDGQQACVFYAAKNLRNLIVRVVVEKSEGSMFSPDLDHLSVTLERISLEVDPAQFRPPVGYVRDDSLRVSLQPQERFNGHESDMEPLPNDPPQCEGIEVKMDASSREVTLTARATDPEGDELTFQWNSTGGALKGSGSTVTLDTNGLGPGDYIVTVSVADGFHDWIKCTVTIRVPFPW